jgi:hypothetical protein
LFPRFSRGNHSARPILETLESSLKWEARSLAFAFVAATTFLFVPDLGLKIAFVGGIFTVVMDTVFSVLITFIFLQPIIKMLREGDVDALQATRFKKMHQMKWMNLVGSTAAVASSTALYVMGTLAFVVGKHFWSNPWLNAFVFGKNMDSVVNDFAMMCLCGMPLQLYVCLSGPRKRQRNKQKYIVSPEPRNVNLPTTPLKIPSPLPIMGPEYSCNNAAATNSNSPGLPLPIAIA